MSMNDTPVLGDTYCPDCEPERDPTREILTTRYCFLHTRDVYGSEDVIARTRDIGTGIGTEAEGATCREFANFLRGTR